MGWDQIHQGVHEVTCERKFGSTKATFRQQQLVQTLAFVSLQHELKAPYDIKSHVCIDYLVPRRHWCSRGTWLSTIQQHL